MDDCFRMDISPGTHADSAWAIPLWVGKNEYWLCLWQPLLKNSESCVTVGRVTRTAGILAYRWFKVLAVNGASGSHRLYASLIRVDPHRLKVSQRDELPRNGPYLSMLNLLLSEENWRAASQFWTETVPRCGCTVHCVDVTSRDLCSCT